MATKDEKIRMALLVESHRLIAQAAADAAAKVGRPNPRRKRRVRGSLVGGESAAVDRSPGWKEALASMERSAQQLLSYPPKDVLSASEELALTTLKLRPTERRALEKLVADACASAFFHFFCLIDAAGDPETVPAPVWMGAWITAPQDDRDMPMLHDQFYELYWEYERRMSRGAERQTPASTPRGRRRRGAGTGGTSGLPNPTLQQSAKLPPSGRSRGRS
jgi:hypothetical protein